MNEDQRCRCCGTAVQPSFVAPAWRVDTWVDIDVGECRNCGSLTVLSNDVAVDEPVAWSLVQGHDATTDLASMAQKDEMVVRVPLAQGPVWHEYRDNWMAINPLRHRWVPTLDGLTAAATRAGLRIAEVVGECPVEHFVESEMIANRVPEHRRSAVQLDRRLLAEFERKASRNTAMYDCPEATLFLRKKGRR